MAKKDPARAPSTEAGVAEAVRPEPKALVAPAAAPLEEGRPGIGSRVKGRAKAAFRVLRRRRVLIVGGAVTVVALNVWMVIALDGWRGEDAALRAENVGLGLELAEARATAAHQVEEIALVTKQAEAAQEKAEELAPVAEAQQALSDSLKAAGILMRQCVNDRATLIANLWASSASAQAGLEAQVNATCASAQAAFEAIPKEN